MLRLFQYFLFIFDKTLIYMARISKNRTIVKLIQDKTKVSRQDIVDVLLALSEALPEAFIIENPTQNEVVMFPFLNIKWRITKWGPGISIKPSASFTNTIKKLKVEGKHPLAIKLFDLMHPVGQQKITKTYENQANNNKLPSDY